MSKVIHLSDDAHNTAKGFCRQHGLKMSDWVAALIADAIAQGRTDPKTPPRASQPSIAVVPVVSPVYVSPEPPVVREIMPGTVDEAVAPAVVQAAQANGAIVSPSSPPKKKLERFREESAPAADGVPPWASPPFWSKTSEGK